MGAEMSWGPSRRQQSHDPGIFGAGPKRRGEMEGPARGSWGDSCREEQSDEARVLAPTALQCVSKVKVN